MRFQRVYRIGGLALIVAAFIQAVSTVFDPDIIAGVNAIAAPDWLPTHIGFAVAYTLALPGLLALYV